MEFLDLGTKPISEASPSGDDAKYEPEYDELQQEIDKLSIASADQSQIDWKKVIKLGAIILSQKSKDFKIATYLGVALMQVRQVEGLSTGVQIMIDLVTNFWDTMYPPKKRMRGRFNAVRWWVEKTDSFLMSYKGPELSQEEAKLLVERISTLDEMLAEKSDEAPILREIQGKASRLPTVAPEPEPTPTPEAPPSEEPAEQTAQQAEQEAGQPPAQEPASLPPQQTPPPPPSQGSQAAPAALDSEDTTQLLRDSLNQLSTVADALHTADILDPRSYRLRRIAAWMQIKGLPPAENRKTQIPAPDSILMTSIQTQFNNGEYEAVVRACESRIRQFLFWLDLTCYCAKALDKMGDKAAKALEAIKAETMIFTTAVKGIENLSFSDGTPFASKETKLWLKSLLPAAEPTSSVSSSDNSKIVKEIQNATKLATEKKISDALNLLQNMLDESGKGKDRFLVSVCLAGMLSEQGFETIACAHANEIVQMVDNYNLEQWDSALAANGLGVAYQTFSSAEDDASKALAEKVLARLSRISPAAAYNIMENNS